MTHKILVIDDEEPILRTIEKILTKEGYEVITTNSATKGLSLVKQNNVEIVLLDIMMPELDGVEALKQIKNFNPEINVIIMTGYPTIDTAVETIKFGAENYILKPFDKTVLINTIKNSLLNIKLKNYSIQQEKFLELVPIVNNYLLRKFSEKEFLNYILEFVLKYLSSISGIIFWYNEPNHMIEVLVSKGINIDNSVFKLDNETETKLLSITEPTLVIQPQQTDFCKTIIPIKNNEIILALPLKYEENKICGIIDVILPNNHEFLVKDFDKNILSSLSNFLTFVLSNYVYTKKLVEYNKLKSEFVSRITHDLKTPLMAINGATELLLEQETDENKKNLLQLIARNTNRMETLVKNLLDFSRIEVGEFKLKKDWIDIVALFNNFIEEISFLAKTKNIVIETNFPNEKIEIFVDKERVEQIISNLISNAIKFTKEGGKIKCSIEKINLNNQEQYETLKITISDTGIGIAKDNLDKIFDKFYQVNTNNIEVQNTGYGIGLSVVKSLIEAHNGKIEVESELNKGTNFYIYLPLTTN